MSAKGQKLTRGLVSRDVRFVPKADIITINGEKRRGGGQTPPPNCISRPENREQMPLFGRRQSWRTTVFG
jgi:hypothetical protein